MTSTPLASRPVLYDDITDVYTGFYHLCASRSYNDAGPQPLGLRDVLAYMDDRHILAADDRYEFEHLIRTADNQFLRLAHEQLAQQRDRLLNSSRSSSS